MSNLCCLELLLLNVCWIEGLEVIAKSWATFGDIGEGVASPGCMTAVRGVVMCHGHWSGGGLGLFSWLYSNCLPWPVGGVIIVHFHVNHIRRSCSCGVGVSLPF